MGKQAATRRVLFDSLGISVVDFSCPAHVESLGLEEPNATHEIVFIRRGVFGRRYRDETLVADPNHVLFFNADQPYRYSHPIPGGDDCTILAVESARAVELVVRHAPQDARPEMPFRRGHALSSRRAAGLHWELLRLLKRPVPRLALEDALAELADEAVCNAYQAPGAPTCSDNPSALARRRRRELVEAAKVVLNERFDAPPTLTELGGSLGCSPFHLSRIFHAGIGVSLRHYFNRLRARIAADRLAGGAQTSVTWPSILATRTTATSPTLSARNGECRHPDFGPNGPPRESPPSGSDVALFAGIDRVQSHRLRVPKTLAVKASFRQRVGPSLRETTSYIL